MAYVRALEYIKAKSPSVKDLKRIITDFSLAWEHLPTEYLDKPEIWEALLPSMGATALIRNVGRMTANGLIAPLSNAALFVADTLHDTEFLKRGKVHPFSLLLAQTTYAEGHGVKGSLVWNPVPQVLDSLEDAFYDSFNYVRPTGKNFYLAIDCSASMTWETSRIANTHIHAREGSACMAMVSLRTEQNSYATGFTSTGRGYGSSRSAVQDLGLSKNMRLDQVVKTLERVSAGGTDCAAPIKDALARKIPVDAFVVYTDNDTNSATSEHPIVALERYRQATGRDTKLIVVSMASNGHSIADPNDAGTLDIAGFDADCPALISEFVGYQKPAEAQTTRRRKAA